MATANNLSLLPPELLRKGRFDEIFFVDLPDDGERESIWKIHLGLRKQDVKSSICSRSSAPATASAVRKSNRLWSQASIAHSTKKHR